MFRYLQQISATCTPAYSCTRYKVFWHYISNVILTNVILGWFQKRGVQSNVYSCLIVWFGILFFIWTYIQNITFLILHARTLHHTLSHIVYYFALKTSRYITLCAWYITHTKMDRQVKKCNGCNAIKAYLETVKLLSKLKSLIHDITWYKQYRGSNSNPNKI